MGERVLGKKLVRTVRGHKVVVQAWREEDDHGFAMADFSIGQVFAGSPDDDLSASGTVRWDGCINWSDGGGTANHFCDPIALDAWSLAMRAVWEMAAEVIDMEPTPIACSMTTEDVARRPEDDDEPDCGKCSQNHGDPGPACQQCVAGGGHAVIACGVAEDGRVQLRNDWLGEDWFEPGDGAIRPKNCENCRFLVGQPPTFAGAGQCGCPRNLSGKAVVGQDCHLWEPKGDTRSPRVVPCPDCAGAPLQASEPFSQASAAVCPTCSGEGKVDRAVANAYAQGQASVQSKLDAMTKRRNLLKTQIDRTFPRMLSEGQQRVEIVTHLASLLANLLKEHAYDAWEGIAIDVETILDPGSGVPSSEHTRTDGDDVDVTLRVRRANLPAMVRGVTLGFDGDSGQPIRLRLKVVKGEASTYTIEVETNRMIAMMSVPDPANVEPVDPSEVSRGE